MLRAYLEGAWPRARPAGRWLDWLALPPQGPRSWLAGDGAAAPRAPPAPIAPYERHAPPKKGSALPGPASRCGGRGATDQPVLLQSLELLLVRTARVGGATSTESTHCFAYSS